jgi:hypothetical protein
MAEKNNDRKTRNREARGEKRPPGNFFKFISLDSLFITVIGRSGLHTFMIKTKKKSGRVSGWLLGMELFIFFWHLRLLGCWRLLFRFGVGWLGDRLIDQDCTAKAGLVIDW